MRADPSQWPHHPLDGAGVLWAAASREQESWDGPVPPPPPPRLIHYDPGFGLPRQSL